MSAQQLSTLIIGSNQSFVKKLSKIATKAGFEVAAMLDNSAAALEYILSTPLDFILVTSQLAGRLNSLELVEKLQFLNIRFILVNPVDFTFEQAAQKKLSQFSFWSTPLTVTSLRKVLDKALLKAANKEKNGHPLNGLSDSSKPLFFKNQSIFVKIPTEQLLFIESTKNYLTAYTETEKIVSKLKLLEIEQLLDKQDFLRIHRRYIVNIHKITAVNLAKNLVYIDENKIPIGRTKKPLLVEKIHLIQ